MMTPQMYDAQADTIKVEDITTDDANRVILRRIKSNSADDENNQELLIQNQHAEDGEDCIDYVPEDAYDMGWLGYFISKGDCLKELYIRDFEPTSGASIAEVLEPFFSGLTNNKSINMLNFSVMDLSGGQIFTMIVPFFKHNDSLDVLSIEECILGNEGSRLLALALGACKKSLQNVTLLNSNISDEGLVDIITSLSMHPDLQYLDLDGNRPRKNGCIALATLLQHSATELETLDLGNVELDDEGIDSLVPTLRSCSHMKTLRLCGNTAITLKGWQQVASILASQNISITDLNVQESNVDDEALITFATSLVNNRTLVSFDFTSSIPITEKGWQSFSKLLCDTSSVNSAFLSNHTLRYCDVGTNVIDTVRPLLDLNGREDKKEVAMIKILQNHNEFDMMPFFEWEFKVLPLVLNWFERASTIPMPENFKPNIGPRKLSSIYQFVRGMPLLYVETRLRREFDDIKAAQAQMKKEQEESKGKLLDLETKHQSSQKRKRSITERLDQWL